MTQEIPILKSKLQFSGALDCVFRDRLSPLMDQISSSRLTTVIAGAGYGKTTFVDQAATHLSADTVWYRLDAYDNDFSTFLRYLIAGIMHFYPETGLQTLARLKEAPVQKQEQRFVLSIFLSELEKCVENDILLVLDDYQMVQSCQEINEAIEFLLDNLTPQLHIVITSRSELPLKISHFRARREALDVSERDLVFTTNEIKDLYKRLFNVSLSEKNLMQLQQKTEGWVSGLILFYHAFQGKTPQEIEELYSGLDGSHKFISRYLEEIVLEQQSSGVKDFLVKSSLLMRLNIEFCNQVFTISNSREILQDLENNHLFTFSVNRKNGDYCYHHLLQEYLQTKLYQTLAPEDILNLHLKIAVTWEQYGQYEEAIDHYLKGGKTSDAARLIGEIGHQYLLEGRISRLQEYIKKIPKKRAAKEPWLQYISGMLVAQLGNHKEAHKRLEIASRLFKEQENSEGMNACLSDFGLHAISEGNFSKAEKIYLNLLQQITPSTENHLIVLAALVFICAHSGKIKESERYDNDGLDRLSEIEDDGNQITLKLRVHLKLNMSFAYQATGDFQKARNLIFQEKKGIEKHGLYYLLAIYHQVVSVLDFFSGDFEKGLESAEEGLRILQERGFCNFTVGWLLHAAGINCAGLRKVPEALAYCQQALQLFKDMNSTFGMALVSNTLFRVNQLVNDWEASIDYAHQCRDLLNESNIPFLEGRQDLAEAVCHIEIHQFEKALQGLKKAETKLISFNFDIFHLNLIYARYYHLQNDKPNVQVYLSKAIALSQAKQYDTGLLNVFEWALPYIIQFYASDQHKTYLESLLAKVLEKEAQKEEKIVSDALVNLSKETDSSTRKAAMLVLNLRPASPVKGLEVFCLGTFRVLRGDEKIPTQSWKNKNAKRLFKYLVYHRKRGYQPKEILMELLWPDIDADSARVRLHNVLPALRRILEPGLSRSTPSSYLLRDGDSYKINLGENGTTDVEKFENALLEARKEKDPDQSINHLLTAAKIYKGDLFSEDIYDDWCSEERRGFQEDYLNLLIRIMDYYESTGDIDKCTEYAKKYLLVDKYAENVYRRLMRYYNTFKDKAGLSKTYDRCKTLIETEMDCSLSQETINLYEEFS